MERLTRTVQKQRQPSVTLVHAAKIKREEKHVEDSCNFYSLVRNAHIFSVAIKKNSYFTSV